MVWGCVGISRTRTRILRSGELCGPSRIHDSILDLVLLVARAAWRDNLNSDLDSEALVPWHLGLGLTLELITTSSTTVIVEL